jgi:hypothetical protein
VERLLTTMFIARPIWLVCLAVSLLVSALATPTPPTKLPDLYEASLAELQEGLDAGHFTSVDLIKVGSIYHHRYSKMGLIICIGVLCSY